MPKPEQPRTSSARAYARLAGLLLAAAGGAHAQEPDADGAEIAPVPSVLQPLAARSAVLDIARAGSRLVAVGDRGHILLSDDGAQWRQVVAPVDTLLTAVAFADARNGWAVGHDTAILRTADGGETWTLQHFEPTREAPLLDVLFADERRGYAIGAYGTYFATADGGASWEEPDASALREEELHLNAIVRLGDGALLVAGENGLLALSDDGLEYARLPAPYAGSLFGAVAVGGRGAAIFGLRGNAYLSDDVRAGRWVQVATGTVASLFGGAQLPDDRVALVGAGGTLLLVGPASASARTQTTETPATLAAVLPLEGGWLLAGKAGVNRIEARP